MTKQDKAARVYNTDGIKVGFKYFDQRGEFRVMAVAEGYYMCRRKGAMPAIFMVKDLVSALNGNRLAIGKPVKDVNPVCAKCDKTIWEHKELDYSGECDNPCKFERRK